jgi:O-antigen/teichoic acid export membrane protein
MVFRFFRNIIGAGSTAAAIGQGFLSNGLLLLLNVVTGIITARALGPEGRGELAALLAVPTFVCFLAPLGLSSALVFESKSGRSTADAISATALLLAIVLGIVAALLAAIGTPWVLNTHQPALVTTAVWLSAFSILGLLANLGMAVLQGKEKFSQCNAIRVAQPVLTVLAMAVVVMGPGLNPLQAALITFCAGFPGLIWNLWLIRPKASVPLQAIRHAFRNLYRYALRASSGDLLSGLAGQLDKIVVVALFAPREVGLFTVAMSLSRVLLVAPQAVTQVLLARTAGRTVDEVITTVTRTAAVTLAMVSIGAVLLWLTGPVLLSLLYSKDFAAGTILLQLLLLEACVTAMHQVLSQPFLALDRPGALGVQQAAGVITSVALLFLLSGPVGIVGAAWALLGGAVVRLVATLVMFRAVLRLPMPRVFAEMGPSLALLVSRLRGGTL